MFIVICGQDDFTIREKLNQIKSESITEGLGEADTSFFDGKTVSFEELVMACNTISFMAPKRLVVVEGLLGRFEVKKKRGKGKSKSPELNKWASLVDLAMPDSTILIVLDGDIKKTNPLFKKMVKVAEVIECHPIDNKNGELGRWIETRVRSTGGEIKQAAVSALINLIGNNLWILSSEIEKLSLYATGRRIEESDVNLLVSNAREANVFHMVDAIIQRRHTQAARILHQHLSEGDPPVYLLFMITNEFRTLLQAKKLSEAKVPVKEIGPQIGEFKEWKIEKLLRQSHGYSAVRIENAYRKLLETDILIKSGKMEGETALDLVVADLSKR